MLDLWCKKWTIVHGYRGEDDTWIWREVDAFGDHYTTKMIPLIILTLRWVKEDSWGGGEEREIELREEIYAREHRTHEHSELTLKKSNSLINNNIRFFLTIFPLYREEKMES